MATLPVLLPGQSHGWRSLEGCSPWGREELDTTERLHFHFSLSCIGEGNGNPHQCSCLENPRDGGAVYGVAQSRTRLKWLSSSSSSRTIEAKVKNYRIIKNCISFALTLIFYVFNKLFILYWGTANQQTMLWQFQVDSEGTQSYIYSPPNSPPIQAAT